jgi:hypothetical protein
VAAIGVIGKNPDKGVVYRYLGHRDIGDPGDKVFMHFGFVQPAVSTSERREIVGANCPYNGESKPGDERFDPDERFDYGHGVEVTWTRS